MNVLPSLTGLPSPANGLGAGVPSGPYARFRHPIPVGQPTRLLARFNPAMPTRMKTMQPARYSRWRAVHAGLTIG